MSRLDMDAERMVELSMTNTNLYGAPFAGFHSSLFPIMSDTYYTEEGVARLAELFPTTIYFSTEVR